MSDARKLAQVSLHCARSSLVHKNYGRAFANFLLFLKLAPERSEEVRNEFSVSMREWSESLERDGRMEDLFKCYDQACEMFPNHDTVLNNIGAQLFRLGYPDEAGAFIRRALIINPDYLAARENLENICSHLVERWHFRMLNDVKRNKAYRDAIRRAVNKGYDSVIDIGAGTGILSLIAYDAGASVVYACEESRAMYEVASDVLRANSANDKILLLHQSSTDLSVPDDLPERVSLVVTETFDAGLFGEHIISTLTHAWRNLLSNVPAMMGSVIPCAATMYVCAIESEALRKQNRLLYPMLQNLDLSGVDIVCTTGQVAEEPYTTENLARLSGGYKMLTNVSELLRVNFCNPNELETLQLGKDWQATLIVKQHGHLDALAVWFDLHLDERVTITTSPDTENCWEQAIYPVLSLHREKDTGQGICYLNKQEQLQVTFHFEHDCLRLSNCVVRLNEKYASSKQSVEGSTKLCSSGVPPDKTSSTNYGSSTLPFRKRKIRHDFSLGDRKYAAESGASDEISKAHLMRDTEAGDGLSQIAASKENQITIAADEYLQQQCGNLAINSGKTPSKASQQSKFLNLNMSCKSATQSSTSAALDDISLTDRNINKDNQFSLLSQWDGNKDKVFSDIDDFEKGGSTGLPDNTPKQLVEYLDDSEEEDEIIGVFNLRKVITEKQNKELDIDSAVFGVKNSDQILDGTERLFSDQANSDVVSESAASNYDVESCHEKLDILIPIDNLEVINEEQYCDTVTSMQHCKIVDNAYQENSKEGPGYAGLKSEDTCLVKRSNCKHVCLSEHSDIQYLNDMHLNRSCFKVLEMLKKRQDGVSSLSILYNTDRLCFTALQAKSLMFDPVTMVTSEEHHGTLQTVMAAANIKPGDVRLLDLSETISDENKYDVIMFDLIESCGILRQQVFEDLELLRVTALSESGVIVPGKVTIQGMFIESAELENASHVTGSDNTLGYSIADFINVFQLRNHVNIDLETLTYTKLTEVFQLFHLDLNPASDSCSLECLHQSNEVAVKVLEPGTITALVYWFELELLEDIKICTLDPRCHWKQAAIMLKQETNVEMDQCLVAMMTLQNSCLDVRVKSSLPVNGSLSASGFV